MHPLFGALFRLTIDQIDEVESDELSRTAFAFAKMNYSFPMLFDALGKRAYFLMEDLSPRHFSSLVVAFASLPLEVQSRSSFLEHAESHYKHVSMSENGANARQEWKQRSGIIQKAFSKIGQQKEQFAAINKERAQSAVRQMLLAESKIIRYPPHALALAIQMPAVSIADRPTE